MNLLPSCALLGGAILLAGPAGAGDPGGANPPADLLARADAAWKDRDQPGKLDQIRRWLDEAEQAAPGDYAVLWRQARLYFWLSDDDLPPDDKSRLGQRAWDYGDRAAKANPKGVEGWYFAAAGMGNYALGIGVLKALTQGIEGKFKERLSRAESIEPDFFDGGVQVAWGRFYFKLPWPKHDDAASDRHLRKALEQNPHNVRARLYLAEVYQKQGHTKQARQVLEDALLREPGIYDGPEERRSQQRARAMLAELKS
jgi:tetratricopeptide (TPR) repeat protein